MGLPEHDLPRHLVTGQLANDAVKVERDESEHASETSAVDWTTTGTLAALAVVRGNYIQGAQTVLAKVFDGENSFGISSGLTSLLGTRRPEQGGSGSPRAGDVDPPRHPLPGQAPRNALPGDPVPGAGTPVDPPRHPLPLPGHPGPVDHSSGDPAVDPSPLLTNLKRAHGMPPSPDGSEVQQPSLLLPAPGEAEIQPPAPGGTAAAPAPVLLKAAERRHPAPAPGGSEDAEPPSLLQQAARSLSVAPGEPLPPAITLTKDLLLNGTKAAEEVVQATMQAGLQALQPGPVVADIVNGGMRAIRHAADRIITAEPGSESPPTSGSISEPKIHSTARDGINNVLTTLFGFDLNTAVNPPTLRKLDAGNQAPSPSLSGPQELRELNGSHSGTKPPELGGVEPDLMDQVTKVVNAAAARVTHAGERSPIPGSGDDVEKPETKTLNAGAARSAAIAFINTVLGVDLNNSNNGHNNGVGGNDTSQPRSTKKELVVLPVEAGPSQAGTEDARAIAAATAALARANNPGGTTTEKDKYQVLEAVNAAVTYVQNGIHVATDYFLREKEKLNQGGEASDPLRQLNPFSQPAVRTAEPAPAPPLEPDPSQEARKLGLLLGNTFVRAPGDGPSIVVEPQNGGKVLHVVLDNPTPPPTTPVPLKVRDDNPHDNPLNNSTTLVVRVAPADEVEPKPLKVVEGHATDLPPAQDLARLQSALLRNTLGETAALSALRSDNVLPVKIDPRETETAGASQIFRSIDRNALTADSTIAALRIENLTTRANNDGDAVRFPVATASLPVRSADSGSGEALTGTGSFRSSFGSLSRETLDALGQITGLKPGEIGRELGPAAGEAGRLSLSGDMGRFAQMLEMGRVTLLPGESGRFTITVAGDGTGRLAQFIDLGKPGDGFNNGRMTGLVDLGKPGDNIAIAVFGVDGRIVRGAFNVGVVDILVDKSGRAIMSDFSGRGIGVVIATGLDVTDIRALTIKGEGKFPFTDITSVRTIDQTGITITTGREIGEKGGRKKKDPNEDEDEEEVIEEDDESNGGLGYFVNGTASQTDPDQQGGGVDPQNMLPGQQVDPNSVLPSVTIVDPDQQPTPDPNVAADPNAAQSNSPSAQQTDAASDVRLNWHEGNRFAGLPADPYAIAMNVQPAAGSQQPLPASVDPLGDAQLSNRWQDQPPLQSDEAQQQFVCPAYAPDGVSADAILDPYIASPDALLTEETLQGQIDPLELRADLDKEKQESARIDWKRRHDDELETLRSWKEKEARRLADTLAADRATRKGRPFVHQEERTRYIVRRGDTLESIAQKVLRDKRLALLIYRCNRAVIRVEHRDNKQIVHLKPNTVLQMPTRTEIELFRATMGSKLMNHPATALEATTRIIYTVRLGDTLHSVASKHPALKDRSLWPLVAELNGLSTQLDAEGKPIAKILRGTTLRLPSPEEKAAFYLQQPAVTSNAV